MKTFILSIFLSLSFSNSQTVLLIDQTTRKPIEDVNVFVYGYGTTTDSNGLCNIDIFKKDDTITFSAVGYETIKINYDAITQVIQLKKELVQLELIDVFGDRKHSIKRYRRLEKKVRKVYPYAEKISEMLVNYSVIIDSLDVYNGIVRYQKKRKIFSRIEKELILKHGYSIKKLKKSEGRILIRLINRQSSKTSYEIIKDFRNILSASFWQIAASIFGHNLHSVYNKSRGEDRLIEHIIKKIENERLKP